MFPTEFTDNAGSQIKHPQQVFPKDKPSAQDCSRERHYD
jgi:hypothetical protein